MFTLCLSPSIFTQLNCSRAKGSTHNTPTSRIVARRLAALSIRTSPMHKNSPTKLYTYFSRQIDGSERRVLGTTYRRAQQSFAIAMPTRVWHTRWPKDSTSTGVVHPIGDFPGLMLSSISVPSPSRCRLAVDTVKSGT